MLDLTDRGADRRAKSGTNIDFSTTVTTAAAALGLMLQLFTSVPSLLGVPGPILNIVVSMIAAGGSLHIIAAKHTKAISTTLTLPNSPTSVEYLFNHYFRQVAKCILFLALLVSVPYNTSAFLVSIDKLPKVLYGYVYDAGTRSPIQGAVIRIFDQHVDVTQESLPSDVNGFYIVESKRKVNRTAYLVASVEGCQQQHKLLLLKDFEIAKLEARDTAAYEFPTFTHYIICP